MPLCKNDPKKTYKGNEPSPKGLGYCAHNENIGVIKKGTDGNKWIITITKKGIKRWIKYKIIVTPDNFKFNKKENIQNKKQSLIKIYTEKDSLKEKWYDDNTDKCDCSKFVSYKRNSSRKYGIKYKDIHGLEFEKGKIYKFISYNNFSKTAIKINEKVWIKYKQSPEDIQQYFCGNKKKLTKDNPIYKKINHIGYKKYFIHNNYEKPYLVYIKNNKNPIYIYHIPGNYNDTYLCEENINSKDKLYWAYIQLALKIIPEKIFIGKSPKNKMTEFSSGYGKYFDGNTILIKLSQNKYVFIGSGIYIFTSEYEIIKYVSPVGNNDVSYPYAIDIKNNYYLMIASVIIPNNNMINYSKLDFDPYDYYYFNCENKNKLNEFKNIENLYSYSWT